MLTNEIKVVQLHVNDIKSIIVRWKIGSISIIGYRAHYFDIVNIVNDKCEEILIK